MGCNLTRSNSRVNYRFHASNRVSPCFSPSQFTRADTRANVASSVHVSGKQEKSNCEHLVPEFEKAGQTGKLRAFCDMTDFHGSRGRTSQDAGLLIDREAGLPLLFTLY